ncbi:hypothetical protein XELAEV_18033608mg [Xenopus laevis]|uniref:Uncharacterized protein n=1 Tax=Xenopus laevis TaxID=8355 RepID=A0A974CLY4_XENLA|nr:hypothetical protein XELAEV_18033608mg [Xenopus laevis]
MEPVKKKKWQSVTMDTFCLVLSGSSPLKCLSSDPIQYFLIKFLLQFPSVLGRKSALFCKEEFLMLNVTSFFPLLAYRYREKDVLELFCASV